MLITSTDELKSLLSRIDGTDVLAIDVEFMRERTYFPRVCLVQVATDSVAAAIDPLADVDLAVLGPVLGDPAVTKVFHSGSQDIEIFDRAFGRPPAPIFDTQVAATIAGFPAQVSYQDLVHSLLGVKLTKAQRFTDWSVRPLSTEQIDYALDDVRYLPAAYRELRTRLEKTGRLAWVADEFERLADPMTYRVVPEEQYRRVKRASSLDRRGLAVLRELAAWREREAQARDVPRRWIAPDEALVEIARRAPRDASELGRVRALPEQTVRRHTSAILAAVGRGLTTPERELPAVEKRKRLGAGASEIVDLMAALVRARCREHGVAPTLVATRDDLERFLEGDPGSPLRRGWRHALVGSELEALRRGDILLGVGDTGIVVQDAPTGRGVGERQEAIFGSEEGSTA